MRYGNPPIKDGINITRQHPLKEFGLLLSAAGLLLLILGILLALLADKAVSLIPFDYEREMAALYPRAPSGHPEVEDYLQEIADRLAPFADLAQGMDIQMHYTNDDTVNAFATLGGHIVIYGGLLQKVESENELAMVIAHEMAHVKHRHPIQSLGRGLTLMIAASAVIGVSSSSAADNLIGNAQALMTLKYSRDQEVEADRTALKALAGRYGHSQGATHFFARMREIEAESNAWNVEFLNTHPQTEERIHSIRQWATAAGWNRQKPLTPLPEGIRNLQLNQAKN